METPQYKVLQDSFMEPNHVKAGSIVRTWGSPGPHLQPMNASAEKRMEEWYQEEFDEIDPKTGKLTGQKVRPHEKLRIRANYASPGDREHIEIVSGPTPEQPGSLSLAETLANPKQATNPRPGPAPGYAPQPPQVAPAPSVPEPELHDPQPSKAEAPPSSEPAVPEPEATEVVFNAPPPSARRNT